jgi:competence protein ComEA
MILLICYNLYLSVLFSTPVQSGPSFSPYRVNLQTDPADVLEVLPGIGPTMAQRIVEFRNEYPIQKADDLVQIHGIGQKTVDQLRWLTTENRTADEYPID